MSMTASPEYPNRVVYIDVAGNESFAFVNPHNGDAVDGLHGLPLNLMWDEEMERYYELDMPTEETSEPVEEEPLPEYDDPEPEYEEEVVYEDDDTWVEPEDGGEFTIEVPTNEEQ